MANPLLGVGATDDIAHTIQVALTPVFLLSGIGTLLNMLNLRQNRIADHVEQLTERVDAEQDQVKCGRLLSHLTRLRRRRTSLDLALILAAIGAASTCSAALVLFLGSVRDAQIAIWLDILFGAALVCTVAALVAFLTDTVLAWHGLRIDGALPRPDPR